MAPSCSDGVLRVRRAIGQVQQTAGRYRDLERISPRHAVASGLRLSGDLHQAAGVPPTDRPAHARLFWASSELSDRSIRSTASATVLTRIRNRTFADVTAGTERGQAIRLLRRLVNRRFCRQVPGHVVGEAAAGIFDHAGQWWGSYPPCRSAQFM